MGEFHQTNPCSVHRTPLFNGSCGINEAYLVDIFKLMFIMACLILGLMVGNITQNTKLTDEFIHKSSDF